MKDRIKKHVDNLFSDIYETKQLQELKEEISANLLENINDLIAKGNSEDMAFEKAVSNLGDMTELVESLKKASEIKSGKEHSKSAPIDKKHVIGYVTASGILLFGIMSGGITYLQRKDLLAALGTLMPFILVSVPIFNYFGLTQETKHAYGMNSKRALLQSLASEMVLIGIVSAGFKYFQGQRPSLIFTVLMPFLVVSAIIYIYLGLTAKSRRKMGAEWEQRWINYYSNPQLTVISDSISGVLWVFCIAAFIFIGITWGWKYSWIVFAIAIICQMLITAIFDPQPAVIRDSITGALWIFSIAAFIFIGITWSWKYSWIVLAVAIICHMSIEAIFAYKQKAKNE